MLRLTSVPPRQSATVTKLPAMHRQARVTATFLYSFRLS
jgi:hypothetical protein